MPSWSRQAQRRKLSSTFARNNCAKRAKRDNIVAFCPFVVYIMRIIPLRTLFLAFLPSLALVVGALLSWPLVSQWHIDISVYAGYTRRLFAGEVPFRDFVVEYPPLALLAFVGPRLMAAGRPLELDEYRLLLLFENALFCVVTTFAVLRVGQVLSIKPRFILLAISVLVFVLSPVLPWRFDMFPAMFTALALLALHEQAMAAGWWLGAGVAAKLYPAVLGPIVVLQFAAERRWRAMAGLVVGGVLALGLTVLPVYLLVGNALLVFLTYHEQRGLQIESVAGGIVALGAKLGWTRAEIVYNFGALHYVSPWADALLPLLTPLLLVTYFALLVIAYRCFRTRPADMATLVAFSCAAVLVFVVTNKVFSPQYLVWLLPFAPLLPRRQLLLFGAICVATVVIFPFGYNAMLALDLWAVVLLNLRNAATIALLLWIVRSAWRARTATVLQQ